jgi:uroporphyrinogen decarboxylase
MTRRERLARALRREPVDRLPVQSNYTGAMGAKLAAHFGCETNELEARLDNHLLRLDVRHTRTLSADGNVAYDWWGAGWDTHTEGYWHAVAPLATEQDLEAFAWPDALAAELCDEAVLAADGGERFVVPNFGLCLFERAWSLRGFDQLLVDLLDAPAWVEALLDRIIAIQVALARRFVALGVDGGYCGDDYGAQRGMLFSPRLWRTLFKPRLARLFAVFREAGLPVILHSDGDIGAILPDLIDIGLTCLNPVQPEIFDLAQLRREYGAHLTFYGGISTQEVLSGGTAEQVRTATAAVARDLAPDGTGLLLGPSHRMQSDIPVENVAAMLAAFAEDLP